MSLDYDYFVNDLGFNVMISQERLYERATATFRKDQFDTTPTVGDQSLTGWWTRGQLSFHKGAGTKFYEIQAAADLIDSFASSRGVDVTQPGWARPYQYPVTVEPTTSFACFDGSPYGRSEMVTGITKTGVIKTLQLALSAGKYSLRPVTLTSAGTPKWYTRGTGYFGSAWFATSVGIEELPNGAGTSLTTKWTLGMGVNAPEKIFYAKDRLFVVNALGDWWDVAGNTTGVLATADCFWRSGKRAQGYTYDPESFVGNWSLTDSPGPVYAAFDNRVYAFTLDNEGMLPTLEAGVTVIELPDGERIFDVKYVAGYVVLATSAGVRVAEVGDGGTLTVGPVFPEATAASSIAAWGDKAIVAAQVGEDGYAVLLVVDLTQRIGTASEALRFAHHLYYWSGIPTHRFLAQNVWGVGPTFSGTAWTTFRVKTRTGWDAYGLFPDPNYQSGRLTTGLHRFGSLDKKWFASVSVRLDASPDTGEIIGDDTVPPPAGGEIEVSVVQADGTVTALGTVGGGEAAVELPIDIASEALALRFELLADGDGGIPYLSGYQLKAMPLPKRQRMIRVPLMLFDREANRTGQIMQKDAWERLAALESLEESNALVTFEDRLTRETGKAYIESVSVERKAPKDFGGVIWLTLRKV